MAKGYRKDSIDFDDRFDTDIVGDGPIAAGLRRDGVPMRYAHIMYGSKGPDVGYRENGVDVSNKWAAKGTAAYASRGGVPDIVENETLSGPGGGSSYAYISYNRNGTVRWTNGFNGSEGGSTWSPGGSTVGDLYDIKFSGSQPSGTTLTGADNVWRQVNTARTVTFGFFSSVGNRTVTTSINVQLRRRSDGAVVVNFTIPTFRASITTDG